MRRAAVVALVGFLLCLVPAGPLSASGASACQFTAAETAEAQSAFERLVKANVVGGAPGAVVDRNLDSYSRAEFAVVLAKSLGLAGEAGYAARQSSFSDLQDHWSAGYVEVLYRQGIVRGNPGGLFAPDAPITVAQVKLMLARTLRLGSDLSLDTADAALRRGGVNTEVPCPDAEQATAGQVYLLLDRALSVSWYARLPEPPPAWAPNLSEIAWAQVRMPLADESATPFYPERSADLPVLTRLITWLRDARPTDGEMTIGGYGTSLRIHLRDGSGRTIFLAVNCVTEEIPGGIRKTCQSPGNEVTVSLPGGEAIRLEAPELAAWLMGAWREDVTTAPAFQVTPLSGGLYRVQGNGWPGVDRMGIWLGGEPPNTCCPPSGGERLAEVAVTFGQFIWEGEVPGDGPFRLLLITKGGSAGEIWVER
ncbi:MAG TPA: S-layer homology domain-containing protein [Symbiobacteriaceae bacterium]|nr:S-layer homology domain-containing protein [Symbiobacteriaceae bacterium]